MPFRFSIPQRWLIYLFSALIVLLALITVIGERGVLHLWRLRGEKNRLDEQNFRLQKENEALRQRIYRIRNDNAYLEKLAQQKVMQLQSASDPPKKLALGERAIQADGNEYNIFQIKESGGPVEPVYATEGTPLVVGPNAIFKNAPNPNAARLFQCFCFSPECQQLISDVGGQRTVHPQVKEKAGRKPFKEIKTMKEDAAGVEKMGEEIRARYSKLFKV